MKHRLQTVICGLHPTTRGKQRCVDHSVAGTHCSFIVRSLFCPKSTKSKLTHWDVHHTDSDSSEDVARQTLLPVGSENRDHEDRIQANSPTAGLCGNCKLSDPFIQAFCTQEAQFSV